MPINFEVKVATVTTAGNGLGRSHALALAARGAKLLVNDLGGARDGSGANVANSDEVQGIVNQTMKKMAVLGLMNTLVLEGAKNNIRVNVLARTTSTRMMEY